MAFGFKFFYAIVFRLEILEDLPGVDSVFICTGGGGLISGIATYMKAMKPSVKVPNDPLSGNAP